MPTRPSTPISADIWLEKPALGRPDVSEVGDPALVRLLGMGLPVERVRRNGRALPVVLRQSTPARSCTESLRLHPPLDTMQAAIDAFRQHIAPRRVGRHRCDRSQ